MMKVGTCLQTVDFFLSLKKSQTFKKLIKKNPCSWLSIKNFSGSVKKNIRSKHIDIETLSQLKVSNNFSWHNPRAYAMICPPMQGPAEALEHQTSTGLGVPGDTWWAKQEHARFDGSYTTRPWNNPLTRWPWAGPLTSEPWSAATLWMGTVSSQGKGRTLPQASAASVSVSIWLPQPPWMATISFYIDPWTPAPPSNISQAPSTQSPDQVSPYMLVGLAFSLTSGL